MNVYFIHNEAAAHMKIGCTIHHPELRLASLSFSRKEKLDLVKWISTSAVDAERAVHYHFREFVIPELGREWFQISRPEVRAFVDYWKDGGSREVLATYRKTRDPKAERRLRYIRARRPLLFLASISPDFKKRLPKEIAELKAKFGIGKWLGRETA